MLLQRFSFPFTILPLTMKSIASKFVALPLLLGSVVIAEPTTAQTAAAPTLPSNALINRLAQTPLTQQDFQNIVCPFYFSHLGLPLPSSSLCNLLSNQPGFWDTTQVHYYTIASCDGTPISTYMNFLGVSGSPTFNFWGLLFPPSQAGSNTPTWARGPQTGASTIPICPSTTLPSFTNPPWFSPSGISVPAIFITPRQSIGSNKSPLPQSVMYGNFVSFNLFRTSSHLAQPLTIGYTTGGSALNGSDYALGLDTGMPASSLTASTITFPANAQSIILQAIVPQPGYNLDRPERDIQVTLIPPSGYNNSNGQGLVASGTFLFLQLPVVSLSQPTAALTPGSTSSFTVSRTGADTSQPLSVSYSLGGTAVNSTDYGYLDGNTVIPAGATSVQVPIVVNLPTTQQPEKTLTLTVNNSTEYRALGQPLSYTIAAHIPAPLPTITITPLNHDTTLNQGSTNGGFVVTRTGSNTQPLVVSYSLAGTAQSGTDYIGAGSGAVTIPAGQSTATVSLYAPTGNDAAIGKTIVVTPQALQNNSYTVGGSAVTLTIAPTLNPQPQPPQLCIVSIVANVSGGFDVYRTNCNSDQPLSIGMRISGPGGTTIDRTLRFDPGQTKIAIPGTDLVGVTDGNGGTVIGTILPGQNYQIGIGSSTTIVPAIPKPQPAPIPQSRDSKGEGSSVGAVLGVLGGAGAIGGLVTGLGRGAAAEVVDGPVLACPTDDRYSQTRSQFAQMMQLRPAELDGKSFAALPAFTTSGNTRFNHRSLAWSAQEKPEQVFTLGHLAGFKNAHCFTLGQIASLSGTDLSRFTLGQMGLPNVTLGSAARTFYREVAARKIQAVPGLAEFLQQAAPENMDITLQELQGLTLARFIQRYPKLAEMGLNQLNLAQLPGLRQVRLQAFPNWQQMPVARVPGLSQIPLSKYPYKVPAPNARPSENPGSSSTPVIGNHR